MTSESLRIVEVEGSRALETFIRLPWSIYKGDPCWVPPLLVERRRHLSKRNPYFAHARCRFWIAYRNDQPVGRISAQIDELHQERYKDRTGFFGMVEGEDDSQTFQALLTTAEEWLRSEGMVRVSGPFNLSINQECGLLIDGFNTPPMIMMGHTKPYYQERMEQNGYGKVKDLFAYRVGIDFAIPPIVKRVMEKTANCVNIRPLRKSHFKEDLRIIREIFAEAWSENWGYVPFTDAEFEELGQELRFLVENNYVQIAEVDGVPMAMMVAFPNVNEIIKDLNGRLLPFGWLKFLWRLKVTFPKTGRVPLMGVRKQHQRSPLGTALAFGLIDTIRAWGLKRKVKEVELSWVLEDNKGMRNILHSIGGAPYKTYRIYTKDL
jgi:GNAT superfamily N-acetyltransferase